MGVRFLTVRCIKWSNTTRGIMIVFEGTDGSGKTTIIDGLKELPYLPYANQNMKYYHWRPYFIKSPKKDKNNNNKKPCTEPHKYPPYNKFISLGKFLYFNLDYVLGYCFKIRPQLFRGNLVVFDRYYYDYYLDKIRYRLDISDRILDFFKIIIPKPEITFILIGDAKVLFERKRELSYTEIINQVERLKMMKTLTNNPNEIDVNQDIETVIFEINKKILECMHNKSLRNNRN